MSKDESSGLLSKVAKFVRNPGMQWSETKDSVQPADAYSKQELKEIIERRRRNDFVRRREFDMLRKVRAAGGAAGIDVGNRPSFFETSTPSPLDDRDSTLKKIDAIEAQMSQQWWEGKPGSRPGSLEPPKGESPDQRGLIADLLEEDEDEADRAPRAFDPTVPAVGRMPEKATNYSSAPTEPMPLGPGRASAPTEPLPLDYGRANAPTEPMPLSFGRANAPTEPMPLRPDRANAPTEPMPLRSMTAAPSQRADLLSADMMQFSAPPADSPAPVPAYHAADLLANKDREFVYDPELEEAAIRFASGDDSAVEAILVTSLARGGPKREDIEIWMTLFDHYRATGAQTKFEAAAIDFAGNFERSAPAWFSLPELLGRMTPDAIKAGPASHADWSSPAVLGIQSMAALSAALDRLPQPWKLSWNKLTRIELAAVAPFEKLLGAWCSKEVQLSFVGADRLMELVKKSAPNGDKSVNQAWWRLHLMLLRLMHRPDEFEVVALDFCITYEVSPPSWENARCSFKALDDQGATLLTHSMVGDSFYGAIPPTRSAAESRDSQHSVMFTQVSVVELAGAFVGDPSAQLKEIDEKLEGAEVMVISCAKLLRVDFTSAGELLNWAAARQAEGRLVQFGSVHRLVAAFFHVIGINEHARIVVRAD